MNIEIVLARLNSMTNAKNAAGMARFGINPKGTLGIPIPKLKALAKEIGKDPQLALKLWKSGIHEAKLLAVFVAEPLKITEKQIKMVVNRFNSWDVCDAACLYVLDRMPGAFERAETLSRSKKEFVKRAGFALMAVLAVHDKQASDKKFESFLVLIKAGAEDERNFVKKAVSWALRQIGKRNGRLNRLAVKTSKELIKRDSKSARWIAADALREFASLNTYVRKRIA